MIHELSPAGPSRLLLDAGNSAVKLILARGRQLQLDSLRSYANEDGSLEMDLAQRWQSGQDCPQEVWIASVAGRDWGQLFDSLNQRYGRVARVTCFSSPAEHPLLRNAYPKPALLGVDRWLAMLGSRLSTRGPSCVADLGTATTVDVIDATGQHLGGWILPGLGTSQQVLRQRGHLLAQSRPQSTHVRTLSFANNTSDAITQGCLAAQVASIEHCMQHLQRHWQAQCEANPLPAARTDDHFRSPGPRLFLTGGWAQAVLGLLSYEATHDPYLIFRGLLAQGDTEVFPLANTSP